MKLSKKRGLVGVNGVLDSQAHSKRGGDADGRGAADFQFANRLPNRRHIVTFDLDKLGRQARLVDQPQMAVDSADPAQRRNYLPWWRRAHVEANLRETLHAEGVRHRSVRNFAIHDVDGLGNRR